MSKGFFLSSSPQSPPVHSCVRSEEHTSELQSRQYLVCRLLLEKKKKKITKIFTTLITNELSTYHQPHITIPLMSYYAHHAHALHIFTSHETYLILQITPVLRLR